MVFFKISDDGVLEFSKTLWIFSIALWSVCAIAYMSALSYEHRDLFQTNFIRGMTFVQYSAKAIFSFAIIKFYIKEHKLFLETANRTIKTVIRITILTKNLRLFGQEFYLIVLGRVFLISLIFIADLPNIKVIHESTDPSFVVQNIFGYVLVNGTFIALDVICLLYISSSAMFLAIGLHLESLVERIRESETKFMAIFRRKKIMKEFCVEIEECSEIYSEIFETITKFHETVQLLILFYIFFTLTSMISGIHVCFINYMKFGGIRWFLLSLRTLQIINLLILVLCVDLMVRRSKIPQNLDWESLYSNYENDEQWDRCIYQFLVRLRLEDLKIDVFGLFSLNREFCLQVFSLMVGYLTIMIQFSMMGYFKEES
ncbi:gustatory receptor for bitter taste 93a-like [Episyrphus balteatus]|uniref:gustatory receptor for bitter taste 93a-like n=1 Tax=Episyrphus balteatus TaxID=286459 RepID=UPI0024866B88|nr:gustatory receptor for bitter taste 93a-like [Episyrphus balteatus]